MYAHVCGCGDAASFASLQVCLPFFRLFLFSVCCFRMGSFLFPSLYARANIIMCLSFSSRVLRYKNLLCNISVIQRITKKFQGIRIICLVKVCLLALKGLLLHPQSREMRHFRQCYWLGETNVGDFLDSDLHLVSYLSGAKGARTDKTPGGWMVRLLWKFRKKNFFKKNFRKHLVVTIKSLTFASAFGNDGKQE